MRCDIPGCQNEGQSVQADPDGRTHDVLCPEHAELIRSGELPPPLRRCYLSPDGKTFICGDPR